jgi:hypothetical protein
MATLREVATVHVIPVGIATPEERESSDRLLTEWVNAGWRIVSTAFDSRREFSYLWVTFQRDD